MATSNQFRYFLVDEDGTVTGSNDERVAQAAKEDDSFIAIIDSRDNADLKINSDYPNGISEQTVFQF